MLGINIDKKRYRRVFGSEEIELVSIREICDFHRKNLSKAIATMAVVMNSWEKTYPQKFIDGKLIEVKEQIIDDIEWDKVSKEGLMELGFRIYRDERVYNVPLDLFPFIPEGTVLTDISGKEFTVGVDNIELFETRFDCIPYGFVRD